MAQRPVLLNEIGKVTSPNFTLPSTRVFVFDALDDSPAYILVYVAQNGKSVLSHHSPLTSFTRSRLPRRDAHIAITDTGEEWAILKMGCGCGSPIRRLSSNQAFSDYSNLQSSSSPEPAPT